jgi:hypothetical protein
MFAKKTVFVVGAGASKDYGLPIGNEFKQQIAAAVVNENEHTLFAALYQNANQGQADAYAAATHQIAEGVVLAPSIDRYMDVHQGNPAILHVGKLAIAHGIQAAEVGSRLQPDDSDRIGLASLADTWLPQLFMQMQEGVRREEPHKVFENIAFVCFNYDRIIQHFMFHAVRTFFALDDRATIEALSYLKIVHPYGRIGLLPWEPRENGVPIVPFTHFRAQPQSLLNMARQIKTFTEQVADDDGAYLKTREYITEAQQVVFLGYGFLDQNMRFLTPPGRCQQGTKFMATVFAESDANVTLAKLAIGRMANGLNSEDYQNFEVKTALPHINAAVFLQQFGNTMRR